MHSDAFPTAKSAGYRMPAEWEPHERCWMAWPCRPELWGPRFPEVQQDYANVANAISSFEPVTMLATPGDVEQARGLCSDRVTILATPLDDSWTRDIGPNFVVNSAGQLAASIFHFNGWGQKYESFGYDAAVGHRIAEHLGIPTFSAPVFMEGGGINVDGHGNVLTTEQCILHPNRNPGLAKDRAEEILCDALGAENVVWLPGDPEDTETDGHVDGIACFVEPGKILVEVCPGEGTERRDNTLANLEAARNATDANGHPFEVFTIDEPYEADRPNDIFASCYVNFYIANGAVVLPRFGIDRDDDARANLARLFPKHEIVQVDVNAIAIGGGGIHCATQQQPASTA